MRGMVVSLSVLAACGRLDFAAQPDGAVVIDAPIPIDAAPVTCATDGAACDDLDICTSTSTCTGGVCVGPPTMGCVVANSADEYTTDAQGQDDWYYGAWNLTADSDGVYDPAVDFETFGPASDGAWHPLDYETNFTWAYIHWWGGHPGSYPEERYPTRRWVSDVSGRANIELELRKADIGGGDGVGALIYVDGVRVFEREIAYDDNTGFIELVPVDLAVGTRVDVMMTFRTEDGGDSSDLRVRIRSR